MRPVKIHEFVPLLSSVFPLPSHGCVQCVFPPHVAFSRVGARAPRFHVHACCHHAPAPHHPGEPPSQLQNKRGAHTSTLCRVILLSLWCIAICCISYLALRIIVSYLIFYFAVLWSMSQDCLPPWLLSSTPSYLLHPSTACLLPQTPCWTTFRHFQIWIHLHSLTFVYVHFGLVFAVCT